MCYLILLKGGTQKQPDSNIAAVIGKEAKSTIVTHGTIKVNMFHFAHLLCLKSRPHFISISTMKLIEFTAHHA